MMLNSLPFVQECDPPSLRLCLRAPVPTACAKAIAVAQAMAQAPKASATRGRRTQRTSISYFHIFTFSHFRIHCFSSLANFLLSLFVLKQKVTQKIKPIRNVLFLIPKVFLRMGAGPVPTSHGLME